jgi:hypothetical protein
MSCQKKRKSKLIVAIHRLLRRIGKQRTGYPQTFPCIDLLNPLSCASGLKNTHILGFRTDLKFDQVKFYPENRVVQFKFLLKQ